MLISRANNSMKCSASFEEFHASLGKLGRDFLKETNEKPSQHPVTHLEFSGTLTHSTIVRHRETLTWSPFPGYVRKPDNNHVYVSH